MPSKSARMRAMVVNRPTCGGPKKAGLVPRSTAFYGRWFMVRRGTNTIDKKKYPRRCQGSGKTLGTNKSLRRSIALLKAYFEVNGLTLALIAFEDIQQAADTQGIGQFTLSFLNPDNYPGRIGNAIKRVNSFAPDGDALNNEQRNNPIAYGAHRLTVLSDKEIKDLRAEGNGCISYVGEKCLGQLIWTPQANHPETFIYAFNGTAKLHTCCCIGSGSSVTEGCCTACVQFKKERLRYNWTCTNACRKLCRGGDNEIPVLASKCDDASLTYDDEGNPNCTPNGCMGMDVINDYGKNRCGTTVCRTFPFVG